VDIEFVCRPDRLTLDEFEHVASLAGEAWHKAVLRWDRSAAAVSPHNAARRISMREQLRTAAEPPMQIKALEAD
jgi:hypothetical protein